MKRTSKTNRGLGCLLICLVAIIIGLTTAIIVVKINQRNSDSDASKEDGPIAIEITDYMGEAEVIYDNDSANLGKVIAYFDKKIQEEENGDEAYSILRLETEWLSMHDVDEEGRLESMMRFDYSRVSGANAYRAYERIIELAESLGKSEIVAKYSELLKTVEDEYMDEYMSVQQRLDEEKEKDL